VFHYSIMSMKFNHSSEKSKLFSAEITMVLTNGNATTRMLMI